MSDKPKDDFFSMFHQAEAYTPTVGDRAFEDWHLEEFGVPSEDNSMAAGYRSAFEAGRLVPAVPILIPPQYEYCDPNPHVFTLLTVDRCGICDAHPDARWHIKREGAL